MCIVRQDIKPFIMAPTKYSNATKEELDKIVKDIIKAIKATTKEQWNDKDVTEVNVDVIQVGHGMRPFGNHYPNDYIDFSISVVGDYGKSVYKADGLGRSDIDKIAVRLNNDAKGYEVEDGDLFFSFGKFIPDMIFPHCFRKFKTPCNEFKKLVKLVEKKYGMEITPLTLREDGRFIAYDSFTCSGYIELIKSFGRKKTTCEVVKNKYGTSLEIKAE